MSFPKVASGGLESAPELLADVTVPVPLALVVACQRVAVGAELDSH